MEQLNSLPIDQNGRLWCEETEIQWVGIWWIQDRWMLIQTGLRQFTLWEKWKEPRPLTTACFIRFTLSLLDRTLYRAQ